jgi:Lar family restriction alleviation protein
LSDLKPCPFCGTNAAVIIVQDEPIGPMPSNRHYIGCDTCGVWFDSERSTQNLIKKWNTRS